MGTYLEPPKMTYYARIRSNLTGQVLTNWKFFDASLWYYGKLNADYGGESEYIVELDVWNNEPAFNAGDYSVHNKNAIACRLGIVPLTTNDDLSDSNTILDLSLFKLDQPFFYGRCRTTYTREEWTPITLNKPLTKLYGTNNPNQIGVLYGNADHMIIQTKIILPEDSNLLSNTRYPFNLSFEYDYQ